MTKTCVCTYVNPTGWHCNFMVKEHSWYIVVKVEVSDWIGLVSGESWEILKLKNLRSCVSRDGINWQDLQIKTWHNLWNGWSFKLVMSARIHGWPHCSHNIIYVSQGLPLFLHSRWLFSTIYVPLKVLAGYRDLGYMLRHLGLYCRGFWFYTFSAYLESFCYHNVWSYYSFRVKKEAFFNTLYIVSWLWVSEINQPA